MMWKFIHLRFDYILSHSLSKNCRFNPNISLLSSITASCTFSQSRACSSTPKLDAKNSTLGDYLIGSLKLPEARTSAVSCRFSRISPLEKLEKVVLFFKNVGFSDEHIQSLARYRRSVLFANIEKTLKPKLIFFQEELGLDGRRLGYLISKHPNILYYSVDRMLKPCILYIKKVLESDGKNRTNEKVNDDLLRILMRCSSIVGYQSRLEANINYLESCGVVGSQLSNLLVTRTRIFVKDQEELSQLVSRALEMHFTLCSRMLSHGIRSLSTMTVQSLNGKFEVFLVFGFSKDELYSMFRKSPLTFGLSAAMLKRKVEFFLDNLNVKKSVLVQYPLLLSFSTEKRVTPRYKVLHKLESMKVLREDSSLYRAMCIPDRQFMDEYIFRYENDADDLLLAYNGLTLDTYKKQC